MFGKLRRPRIQDAGKKSPQFMRIEDAIIGSFRSCQTQACQRRLHLVSTARGNRSVKSRLDATNSQLPWPQLRSPSAGMA